MTPEPAATGGFAAFDCRALGTGCRLAVASGSVEERWRDAFLAELARVDVLASRFRDDSEITALNRSAADSVAVSRDLFDLIAAAMWAAEATGGAADPTVGAAVVAAGYDADIDSLPPDRPGPLPRPGSVPGWRVVALDPEALSVTRPPGVSIDLGATAKAVTADRAAAAVADLAGTGVMVSLGGDVSVAGPPPAGGFPVGVADRWFDPPEATIAIASGGVATSGTAVRSWTVGGRRAHHIIDPRTGLPAEGPWRTVTVVAADCLEANAASTAAVVKGPGALVWLESLDLPARLVGDGGEVALTTAWPRPAPDRSTDALPTVPADTRKGAQ